MLQFVKASLKRQFTDKDPCRRLIIPVLLCSVSPFATCALIVLLFAPPTLTLSLEAVLSYWLVLIPGFVISALIPSFVAYVFNGLVPSAMPDNWWRKSLALIGYSWCWQFILLYSVFHLPTRYTVGARVVEVEFGVLTTFGLAWFVSKGSGLHRSIRWFVVIGVVFQASLCFMVTPTLTYVDGLQAIVETPTILEESRTTWTKPSTPTILVHCSDLHITRSKDRKTYEHNAPGQDHFEDYASSILSVKPQVVLISGDITDSGEIEQWQIAGGLLSGLSRSASVIMSPGNHDLSGAYSQRLLPRTDSHAARLSLYLRLQAQLNPRVLTAQGENLNQVLDINPELVTRRRERLLTNLLTSKDKQLDLRQAAETQGIIIAEDKILTPADVYSESAVRQIMAAEIVREKVGDMFPLQWRSLDESLRVYVLNSCHGATSSTGRSAIGAFDFKELNRLDALIGDALANEKTKIIVVVCHHPIGGPRVVETDFWTVANFAVQQTRPLAATSLGSLLARRAGEAIGGRASPIQWFLCYGHRHQARIARLGPLRMVESPDLRASGDRDRGVWVFFSKGGLVSVEWMDIE